MKQKIFKTSAMIILAAVAAPGALLAQKNTEGKQVIVTSKGTKSEKVTIVVDGDKVTVNGKEIDKNKEDQDVQVTVRNIKDLEAFSWSNPGMPATRNVVGRPVNRALLGVVTAAGDNGVTVRSVSDGSGAEKAGMKENDVITSVDGKKIVTPDDLTSVIRGHKPGDKVTVEYKREGREQKVTAELGKSDSDIVVRGFANRGGETIYDGRVRGMPNAGSTFDFKTDFDIDMKNLPRTYGMLMNNNTPKLGLTVQDTDEGKGVKVLEADDEGNAYLAGVREDDVILEVDGKSVDGADGIARIMKDSKDLKTVKFKVNRAGRTQTLDVKVPRKLKTTSL